MGKFARYLRKVTKADRLERRMGDLEVSFREIEGRLNSSLPNNFPLQRWWERSYWEPTVSLAIRDHCRPGNVAFDVGANAGGIALQMSRLVGPRGIVCAFEASPRIIDKTQYNLVQAGCFNTTVYHCAVYHTSGETVTIYAGDHLNDSIYVTGTGESFRVPTLTLDDFSRASGLVPSLIKMDIEGAEFDALNGASGLLESARPALILEQQPADMRCHELLTGAGYLALDLATYQRIRVAADFPAGSEIVNVLFVHADQAAQSPYFSDAPHEFLARLDETAFERTADGSITLAVPYDLTPGRYLVHADFTGTSVENEVFAGVNADGETIFRYHTNTEFMSTSYRHWPISLDRPARVRPFLRYIRGSDANLSWRGVDIWRLPAFDGHAQPVLV